MSRALLQEMRMLVPIGNVQQIEEHDVEFSFDLLVNMWRPWICASVPCSEFLRNLSDTSAQGGQFAGRAENKSFAQGLLAPDSAKLRTSCVWLWVVRFCAGAFCPGRPAGSSKPSAFCVELAQR